MPAFKKFLQALRDYSVYFLWVAGIFIILANLWNYSKLAPVEARLDVLAQQESDLQKDLELMAQQHSQLLTKEEFTIFSTRVDHISTRLDQVYAIVASRK